MKRLSLTIDVQTLSAAGAQTALAAAEQTAALRV